MSSSRTSENARTRLAALREKKPASKAAQIRALWPEIRTALDNGHSLQAVCDCLAADGIAGVVSFADPVPRNVAGRLVATLVMLGGIGFLTVITAAITSSFVARSREERLDRQDARPSEQALQEIVESLHRLEVAMTDRT